ncbi:hypothetical protein B5X24_HaOG214742 [Helicoverpa armigera]|nr:hypothetical protein B5X24_HaOG214742 [Helicoverpa armigera]
MRTIFQSRPYYRYKSFPVLEYNDIGFVPVGINSPSDISGGRPRPVHDAPARWISAECWPVACSPRGAPPSPTPRVFSNALSFPLSLVAYFISLS